MENYLVSKFGTMLKEAFESIKNAQTITLVTHKDSDPDGIGACSALYEWLLAMHKKIEIIIPSPLDFKARIQLPPISINTHTMVPDLLISCDTANYDRLYFPEVFKVIPLIVIDHHISNTMTGVSNLVVGELSSTCELVTQLFDYWNVAITKMMAERLLFGMLDDTQVFQTQQVNALTLRTAAGLVDAGANLYALAADLREKPIETMVFWGKILSSMTYFKNQLAIVVVTQKDLQDFNVDEVVTFGLSNFLARFLSIDVLVVLLEEKDGMIKASLRGKRTDVNAIANHFNGGGHRFAAGFRITGTSKEITKKLQDLILR